MIFQLPLCYQQLTWMHVLHTCENLWYCIQKPLGILTHPEKHWHSYFVCTCCISCSRCHVMLSYQTMHKVCYSCTAWNKYSVDGIQWHSLSPPLTDLMDDQIQSWPRGIIPYNMSDDLTGVFTHPCHTSHACQHACVLGILYPGHWYVYVRTYICM